MEDLFYGVFKYTVDITDGEKRNFVLYLVDKLTRQHTRYVWPVVGQSNESRLVGPQHADTQQATAGFGVRGLRVLIPGSLTSPRYR